MAVIATVAHPKANSFLSLDEASAFMQMHDPDWITRTVREQENLLLISAGDTCRIPYLGTTWFMNQNLAFPRRGAELVTHYVVTEGISRVEETIYTPEMVETPAELTGREEFTNPTPLPGVLADFVVFTVPAGYVVEDADSLRTLIFESALKEDEDGEFYLLYSILETSPGVWGEVNIERLAVDATEPTPLVETATASVKITGNRLEVRFPDTEGALTPSEFVIGEISRKILTDVPSSKIVPNKVRVSALVLTERDDVYPDFAVGGSVHAYVGGDRAYFDIIAHDISTGDVTLDADLPDWEGMSFAYFDPHFPEVKEAQKIQLMVRACVYDEDPYAGTDIVGVKIGDTTRTYGGPKYGKVTLAQLATRNKVAEQVMVLLGKFSVYGKYGVISQEQYELAMTEDNLVSGG